MAAVDFLAHGTVSVAGPAYVGQRLDQPRNRCAKFALDVLHGGWRVFDHVVEPCRSYHFLVMGDRGNQARYALQVRLIGLIVVLAALVDALMCARCEGSGTFYQLGHRLILGCCRSRSCKCSLA